MAKTEHLSVLIANERRDRLELLAQVVIGLGHDVIAREIYVKEVGAVTAREQPDVALVDITLKTTSGDVEALSSDDGAHIANVERAFEKAFAQRR